MTVRPLALALGLAAASTAYVFARPIQTPTPAAGVATDPATAPLDATIPVDARITTGTLPNGLRYYIRVNHKPEQRAELRLVVNAGSVLEDDDQRGLAHVVEHMSFNGTAHFPKLDIINFMQSIGMRFGPSVNAFTSFDETVYMLQIPTDRAEVIDRSLLILEDWAHAVTFDPVEIDKERGVITEEWRLGRGAGARLQDKQFPVLLQGSRYANRLPIGQMDIVQHFPPERLVQFYKDWYRPDLMAVVAVGDFDPAAMERQIRAHFGALTNPPNERPRPKYDVPDHAGTSYAIASDPEARTTSVSVYHLEPARDQSTVGAYRRQIVEGLYSAMLNARLGEIAQKPNAPFLGASVGQGSLVRTADATTLSAVVPDGGAVAGLDAIFTESERVARFGFTQTELDRIKADVARSLERAVAQRDDEDSADLAAEYIRNFSTGEPIPGIVYENALYQRFLPGITLADVNALAKTWAPDGDRVVLVSAPEKSGVTMPTEAQLSAVMTGVANKTLTAYTDTVTSQPLLASAPTPGSIVSTKTEPEYGVTEWTLSNGARVILKPTTFKQDEVLFRAFSLGGTSIASDADYIPASTAASVVAAGGVGTFSAIDLQKVLTGKAASASPYIGDVDEGLSGAASPKDLETMFQLLYLRFTAPREDPAIFGVLQSQTRAALANQSAQPDFAFNQALTSALWRDHPRMQPMTPERIDQMDLQKSIAFYRARFSDASRFTFVFVGAFEPDAIRPFVERYVASLPSTHGDETWKDVGVHAADGVVMREVRKGIEPKSRTAIVFHGPFQYDQAHRVAIRAMAMALESRLRETLREDLGGTYNVSVSAGYGKIPIERYTVSIAFGSSPDRTNALVTRVFQEIEALKTNGPSASAVTDVRETFLRDYETSARENGFFLREIAARYEYGEGLKDLFGLADFYKKIDAATIQDAARQYLDTSNFVQVKLFPALTGAPATPAAPAAPASSGK